jgi:hypothetical protein
MSPLYPTRELLMLPVEGRQTLFVYRVSPCRPPLVEMRSQSEQASTESLALAAERESSFPHLAFRPRRRRSPGRWGATLVAPGSVSRRVSPRAEDGPDFRHAGSPTQRAATEPVFSGTYQRSPSTLRKRSRPASKRAGGGQTRTALATVISIPVGATPSLRRSSIVQVSALPAGRPTLPANTTEGGPSPPASAPASSSLPLQKIKLADRAPNGARRDPGVADAGRLGGASRARR